MDYIGFYILAFVLILVLIPILVRAMKDIPAYAVGIVTMFGAYKGLLRPGMNVVNPLAMVWTVDLRGQTQAIVPSNFATATGSPVALGGSIDYHVHDAAKSFFQTRDVRETLTTQFRDAVALAVSTTPSEAILSAGWQVARSTRSALSADAARYGVTVDRVRIRVSSPGGSIEFFDGDAAASDPTTSPIRNGSAK